MKAKTVTTKSGLADGFGHLLHKEMDLESNLGDVRNPFVDGQWRLLEVTDDTYEVMSFNDKVFVSYGAELKEKPGNENATVHTLEK